MNIHTLEDSAQLGKAAAARASSLIKEALENGPTHIILATGASQFSMLENLVQADIDWSQVTMFHLDEYVGMSDQHPASFRKYLQERFVDKVAPLKSVIFIEGDASDTRSECQRVSDLIKQHPISVAMIGIGENGHLAFNDPPADFDTEDPYLLVHLDEACRQQQFGEGWFPSFDAVPTTAISMSIRQILKSQHLIVSVPDERKAQAVKGAVSGPVTNLCPASILQTHDACDLYLDQASASLL